MHCDTSALDNPVENSLRELHAPLARRAGAAVTYREGICTFAAVPPAPSASDWHDLSLLVGEGGLADLFSTDVTAPDSWALEFDLDGVQMILDPSAPGGPGAREDPQPEAAVMELGPADVPDMLGLTDVARPGPFFPRTIEMGTYLGVRDGDRLIAMAGERLHPPGWTEISAVCTAPEARGRGLASLLINTLSQRILARGEQPFLHAVNSNSGAILLYERLGFRIRRQVHFHGYRVPGQARP